MDLTIILQAIGTVGFPICACIIIGWYFAKVNDNYRSDIKEINQLASVIQQNTLVIQKLCDSLDDLRKE